MPLLLALAGGISTAIPNGDPSNLFVEAYADTPWLGVLEGKQMLWLDSTTFIPVAGFWE